MSSLCTLQQARKQLMTDTSGTLATEADPSLFGYILSASQAIEDLCGYYFAPHYELLAFSSVTGRNPTLLLNDWPLVQADQILNGDATVLTTDKYSLLPIGRWPKEAIRLAIGTYWLTPVAVDDTTCAWPILPLDSYGEEAIQVTGMWCYHRNWSRAWKDTGLTLGQAMTATQTTLVASGTIGLAFDVGSELMVDSEMFRVYDPVASSLPTGLAATTVNVDRDYDNFTETSRAATHLLGAKIYVFQPEPIVQHACTMAVAAFYKQRDNATGDRQVVSGGAFGSASIITPQDLPSRVKNILQPYRSHWRGRTQ